MWLRLSTFALLPVLVMIGVVLIFFGQKIGCEL
jgi:hypothetical protein